MHPANDAKDGLFDVCCGEVHESQEGRVVEVVPLDGSLDVSF